MKKLCCAALVFCSSLFAQDGVLKGFDAFVEKELKNWKVPGAAVGIVRDGKVILLKGYGLRDVKNRKPVTPQTQFAIASISKSFTVANLAVMVRQGKLEWDRPVREYLPDFRLHDEVATERMTPRDLVTHRTGLPRHDAAWYNSPLTRKELYDRLRYFEPSKDVRTTFQYNNFMFMTAGYLAGVLNGTSWEESVRKNLLEPIGMKTTNFAISDMVKLPDVSLAYQKDDSDNVKEIGYQQLDAMGPTGSMNSNAEEMVKYVAMYLNRGVAGEKEIVNAADIDQMMTPQMVMQSAMRYAEVGHSQYGMAFFITTYRGNKIVHHGGNMDGFAALVAFMPSKNLGMVILTNLDSNPLRTVFSYNVYDRFLGLDQIDWSKRLKEQEAKDKASEADAKKQGITAKRAGTKPSRELGEFAGEYEHPGYGPVTIEAAGGDSLRIRFHDFVSALRHVHFDIFETPQDKLNRLERTKVMFNTNWNGDIASLSIPMETGVKDIVFERVADRMMKAREFLLPLAGQYDLGSLIASVSLRDDNVLVLAIPGQSPYELLPVRGTRFDLRGMSGYTVEFKKDAAGRVTDLAFYQPDGNYVAKRK